MIISKISSLFVKQQLKLKIFTMISVLLTFVLFAATSAAPAGPPHPGPGPKSKHVPLPLAPPPPLLIPSVSLEPLTSALEETRRLFLVVKIWKLSYHPSLFVVVFL